MKLTVVLAAAALLASAGAHAQIEKAPPKPPSAQSGKKPPKKLGVDKSDGRGRSVANDVQQVQSDKYQMRQDKQNKDDRSYKKHQQQMQQDQERVNNNR